MLSYVKLKFFNANAKEIIAKSDIEEGSFYQCKDTGTLYYGSETGLIPTSPIIVDENSDGTGLRSVNSDNTAIGIRSIIAGSNNSTTNGTNSAIFASNISAIKDINKNTGIFASNNSAIYNKSIDQIEQVAIIASASSNFESGYAHSEFTTKNSLIAATSGSKISGTNSAIIGGHGNNITDLNNVVILGGDSIRATEDDFVYLNNLAFTRKDSNGNQYITKILNPDSVDQDTAVNLPKSSGTLLVTGDVQFTQNLTSGTVIGSMTICGVQTDIYAPTPESGGSTVTYVPSITSGISLGSINIDGVDNNVYAPNLTVTDVLTEGTKIGTIMFGDTSTSIYVPESSQFENVYEDGSPLSLVVDEDLHVTENHTIFKGENEIKSVEWDQILTTGLKIANVTLDGETTGVYCPMGEGSYVRVPVFMASQDPNEGYLKKYANNTLTVSMDDVYNEINIYYCQEGTKYIEYTKIDTEILKAMPDYKSMFYTLDASSGKKMFELEQVEVSYSEDSEAETSEIVIHSLMKDNQASEIQIVKIDAIK